MGQQHDTHKLIILFLMNGRRQSKILWPCCCYCLWDDLRPAIDHRKSVRGYNSYTNDNNWKSTVIKRRHSWVESWDLNTIFYRWFNVKFDTTWYWPGSDIGGYSEIPFMRRCHWFSSYSVTENFNLNRCGRHK